MAGVKRAVGRYIVTKESYGATDRLRKDGRRRRGHDYRLDKYVHQAGLNRGLLELVRLRASLINGCAYCVDMHTKVARSQGETEQRLYAMSVWRETPFYTERERAALAWTEAVTLISVDHVPDDVYNRARQHFTEKELVDLTLAIVAINAWNRLAIAFRTVPGTFELGVRSNTAQGVDVKAAR
jgi:AhpD family alkylhydroperoxidase